MSKEVRFNHCFMNPGEGTPVKQLKERPKEARDGSITF